MNEILQPPILEQLAIKFGIHLATFEINYFTLDELWTPPSCTMTAVVIHDLMTTKGKQSIITAVTIYDPNYGYDFNHTYVSPENALPNSFALNNGPSRSHPGQTEFPQLTNAQVNERGNPYSKKGIQRVRAKLIHLHS